LYHEHKSLVFFMFNFLRDRTNHKGGLLSSGETSRPVYPVQLVIEYAKVVYLFHQEDIVKREAKGKFETFIKTKQPWNGRPVLM